MMENKLTKEELKDVSGGMVLGYSRYCNELFEKYGIERGNMDELLKVCTAAERSQINRLKLDQIRNVVIPNIFEEKRPQA